MKEKAPPEIDLGVLVYDFDLLLIIIVLFYANKLISWGFGVLGFWGFGVLGLGFRV